MITENKQYSNEKAIVFDMIGTLTTNPHLISQIFYLTFPSIDTKLVKKYYEDYKVDRIDRKAFWSGVGFDNFLTQEKRFLENINFKQGVLDMLEVLKKQYKLALFSNIPKEWGHYLEEKFEFKDLFEVTIFSGDYGLKKPDKEIYELLLSRLQYINPNNIYFIDDDLEDLKTGKEFLMKTVWLESDQLEKGFKADYVIKDIFEIINIVK